MILCNSNRFGSKSGSKTSRKRYNFQNLAGLASLYRVFPLESSAMCNKKAVLCTAFFVIRATICEQAPIVALTTKATLASGFLVAHCARDSVGMVGFCTRRAQRPLFQTHSALADAVFYTKISRLKYARYRMMKPKNNSLWRTRTVQ